MTFPRSIPAQKLDRKNWAAVEPSMMSKEQQERFNTLKGAVDMYLDGKPPRLVFATHGVSRAWLNKKLHDCVKPGPDGKVQGYRGLLPHATRKPYVRKATVHGTSDGFGSAGGWGKLMREQTWINKLIRDATRGKSGSGVKEAGINVKSIHRDMMEGLEKRGFTPKDYPLHTGNKGYSALCRHINKLLVQGDADLRRAKYGTANEARLDSRSGKTGWLTAHRALSIVCYDEQQLPLIGTLVIEIGDREIHVPMQRCSLCLMVDEFTGAVLAYFISMRRRVSASDVLKVLEHLLTPWKPMALTIPGLRYPVGAALPAGVVEGVLGARVSMMRVDNDLVHYANSILEYAVDRTGIALQYGELARPITRQPVEHVFAMLQTRFLSRIPSTTGSGPDDPAVDDPVGKAVKLKIKMSDVQQVVDIALAQINNTRQVSLINATPLEELAREFSGSRGSVIPRWPTGLVDSPKFPNEILEVTVAGNIAEKRQPYVEHIDGIYTNDLLRDAWTMIGKPLTIHIHDDFRTLQAYHPGGAEFGPLWVTGHWAHSYHTKETRREIIHAKGKDDFDYGRDDDPVALYGDHLARIAAEKGLRKSPKVSVEANKIARMMGPGNLGPHKTTLEAMLHRGSPLSKPAPIRPAAGARWRRGATGGGS